MQTHRWLVTVLFLAVSVSSVSAQDTTQTGFAIVTLVSGNIAGLVATETLTFNDGSITNVAIVPPAALLTSSSMLVSLDPTGGNTTAIAIANPSLGTGSVNLLVTDERGAVVLNTIIPLGPRAQVSRFLSDFFQVPRLPQLSNRLLLTVSAEIPVAILGLNFRGADLAGIPLTSLASPMPVPAQLLFPATPTISPTIGGVAFVFPAVAFGGEWSTEIAVGNTSAGTQTIRIDFFASDGTFLRTRTDVVIPSHGTFVFSPGTQF
jgi:hypothetical protein